ncbi:hypothetical protein H8D79_01070 [PVC group bacterium]|nr:hypothetical protein [PVC group bacterium]
MSDSCVTELISEAAYLTRENRALRCLLDFRSDRDLAVILARARDNGSLGDVLMFVDWALDSRVLLRPERGDECAGRLQGEPAPVS